MNDIQKNQIKELRLQGYGYIKISNMLNLSENTVKSFCRRNNLAGVLKAKDRSKENKMDRYFCRHCGKEIFQNKGTKKKVFCSDKCRKEHWTENQNKINRKTTVSHICKSCGREFDDYIKKKRKYCCHECYVIDRYRRGEINE